MRSRAIILTLVWLSLSVDLGIGGVPDARADAFKRANQLYDEGQFRDAIAAYDAVTPKTAHTFYNLGNAYYRHGELGRALLQYERARRLRPRDPDIQANLRFTAQRLDVETLNQPATAPRRLVDRVVYSRSLREWTVIELTTLWLGLITLAIAILRRQARAVAVLVTIVLLGVWALGAGALAYRLHQAYHGPRAIVVASASEARFAPLPEATVHFTLTEGTAVKVREDRDRWLLVERHDGQQGWVPAATVERLNVR